MCRSELSIPMLFRLPRSGFSFHRYAYQAWPVTHIDCRTGTGEDQPVLRLGPPAWGTVGTAEDMSGFAGIEHRHQFSL